MTSIRLTALANHRGGSAAPDAPQQVVARAQRAERDGFDLVSYADLVHGDPFLPLVLAAQATERVGLMTRLAGAFGRSPVHLASASAWLDQLSGGRFTLGLGASLRRATRDRLGYDFDRPAARMEDTIRIIRGLWGEQGEGRRAKGEGGPRHPSDAAVAQRKKGDLTLTLSPLEEGKQDAQQSTFNVQLSTQKQPSAFSLQPLAYSGPVLSVTRATVDLLPAHRVPILLAAAGPRMLRLAGALADGVILELTTPTYLRWVREQIGIGAASAGRSLDGFEICVQATVLPPDDTRLPVTRRADHLAFFVRHCVDPEFARSWQEGGLGEVAETIRKAHLAGDQATAERLVAERLFPEMAIDCADPASLWRWFEGHRAAGATLFAVPLEIGDLLGVTPDQVRQRLG